MSTTSTSTPGLEQRLGPGRDVAVDADRRARSAAGRARRAPGGRCVDAQRPGAGEHADQPAVAVARPGRAVRRALVQRSNAVARRRRRRGSVKTSVDMTRATWVNRSTPDAVGLGDDADRPPRRSTIAAPCARLWISASASPTVSSGARVTGVSYTRWRAFTQAIDLGDDVERDVLRDHGDAAAAGDGLGHPPSGDRGHVGHDDRDRGPGAVAGRQVDVEPGGDRRAGRAP